MPLIATGLVLTNASHQLLWTNAQLLNVDNALVLSVDFSPIMWLFLLASSALIGWGTLIMVRALMAATRFYLSQVFILIIAVLVPLIVNIASMFNLSPLPSFDLTPMALVISCLMFGAVLFLSLIHI